MAKMLSVFPFLLPLEFELVCKSFLTRINMTRGTFWDSAEVKSMNVSTAPYCLSRENKIVDWTWTGHRIADIHKDCRKCFI